MVINLNKLFGFCPEFAEVSDFGPEPCLSELVYSYYRSHFDEETAEAYTDRYINQFERLTDILH